MERPDEGLNVIDVGTDYGDMPQGIDQDENAVPDDLQKMIAFLWNIKLSFL